MSKQKASDSNLTSSEVLKLTGMSKKELQALDELGILQPEAQKRQGIHLYDEQALKLIQRFTFYDKLGLPMEAIRELINSPSVQEDGTILETQMMLLIMKVDTLKSNMATIEAAQALARAGKPIPWAILTHMHAEVPGRDMEFWDMTPEEDSYEEDLLNGEQFLEHFQTWKRLLITSAIYQHAGVQPEEQLAKALALDWMYWRREVKSKSPSLFRQLAALEKTEPWLNRPPFVKVLAWRDQLEAGL